MKPLVGKRRTREHVIADLAINFVERQALRCGYIVTRQVPDYGTDLAMTTFADNGELEAGKILMQVKATDKLRLRAGQLRFSFRIERAHLMLWRVQPMPMILVVYDAHKVAAYWLYVQSYFRKLKGFNLFAVGETITVQMPVANKLHLRAVRRFRRFRDRIAEQTREVIIHDEDENDAVR